MKKGRKFLSLFLAILIVVSIIPVTSIETEAAESWLWPVAGYTNWTTYANHRGIDIPAPSGTPIRATKSGTLYVYNNTCNGSHYGASPSCTISGCNSNTGKCVYIIHGDGTASCYMHMVSLAITSTKWVNQGDVIGYVGTTGPSTGNHLHFEAASGSGTNYWSYSLMNPGNLSYIYNTSIATTGITLNKLNFSMFKGEKVTLSATVSPSNATNKTVTWSSNNNSIATVSSTGVVNAVSKGACTITAKASGGQTATVVIIVKEDVLPPTANTTYNGHYYELYEDVLSWKDAKDYCESIGGHLVTITSQAENDIVQQLAKQGKRENVYIGATDENKEGTWEWITGETFSFMNLGDGEPSAIEYDIEDYLRLGAPTGKWQDIRDIPYSVDSCGFVCEYDEIENDDALTELPEDADPSDYEAITEYRSRNKLTTTSTSSSMNGWTLYDSESTYGAWSSVQSTSTKPTESETLQITGTWTQYHYYHHLNYYSGCYNIDSIAYGTHHGKHTIDRNSPLSTVSMADQGGKQAYGSQTCSCGFNFWFLSGTTTFYNYQTRSKSTTNYFYKWTNWSSWSTTPISATETKQVEKRTVYRLKDEVEKPALTGWVKDDGGWKFYNVDGTFATNKWLMDSVGWCYVGEDGYCVTNCWKADSHGWCYLDANGRMVCNNWVYDAGKWYFMDANGYMVSNQWRKDSKGWCYLSSSGAMLTNAWVKDSVGWCYVGADGYCVTNKWVKDSKGWCYLDSNGRMVTNKWVKDSKGWCYVGSSGYMVTSQWVQDGSNWYYIDQNGYMVTGTKVINGKTYKFNSSGVWIA